MTRAGIIGIGISRMESDSPLSEVDLAKEAIEKAVRYAEIDYNDIDYFIECAFSSHNDISDVVRKIPLKGVKKHTFLRNIDGAFGAVYAVTSIMSGESKIALVVGYGKGSETDLKYLSSLFSQAEYLRGTGLDYISFSALQAKIFMDRLGIGEEELGMIVIKNRRNGFANEDAHIREKIILEDILASPYVAEPIRKLMMAPRTDGAAAMIFARGDIVKTKQRRAWIDGFGVNMGPYYPGYEDIAHLNSLRYAARRAYKLSGIKNPKREVDFAEIVDVFPHIELMSIEALELVAEKRLVKPIHDGSFFKEGKLPINPSGGALCTNPPGAVGLIRMIEITKRLVGDVMDIRKQLRRGVANAWTFFHQYDAVWVIAGE
ncbi:MAG: thiolase family protein [bacterium]|nr:thiolase family protein [bacterium]